MTATTRGGKGEERLEEVLARLKRETGLGNHLQVAWHPKPDSNRHGEVKETVIYVYDVDVGEAVQTLRHEFWDFLITSRIVKPLVGLVNLLIHSKESEIYQEKEKIVEALSRITA